MNNLRLKDKIALITGASAGIGRAISIIFSQEGANVIINYNNNEKGASETLNIIEKKTYNKKSFYCKADVSNSFEVKEMVNKSIEKFGKIDILVNNSGINQARIDTSDNIIELSEKEWDRVIDVNLKGIFLTSKYVLPHMIKQNSGSIINISSILGTSGWFNSASYCASKGGIITLTKEMAIDYGKYNIRVNSISPGFTQTAMYDYTLSHNTIDSEATVKFINSLSVLNRTGKPEEIAQAALFLASSESSFITGINLLVDGGLSAK